ncbi:PKD domain-containing protein [Patescibacteria group bacterium]
MNSKYRVKIRREPLIEKKQRKLFDKRFWIISGSALLAVIIVVGVVLFISGRRAQEDMALGEVPTAEKGTAVLIIEEGTAQVSGHTSDTWENALDRQSLQPGDKVRTLSDGRVTLRFDDDSIARLNVNSHIVIEDIDSENGVRILLSEGQAWSYVPSDVMYGRAPFSIYTANTLATATGTTYNLSNAANGDTKTCVTSGTITVDAIIMEAILRASDEPIEEPVSEETVTNDEGADGDVTVSNDNDAVSSPPYTGPNLLSQAQMNLNSNECVTIKTDTLPSDTDDFDVKALADADKNAYWYRWNQEKDEAYRNQLEDTEDTTAPTLKISEPSDGDTVNDAELTIKGTTEIFATVLVDDKKVDNKQGAFETTVTLEEGDNAIVVKAMDPAGNEATQTLNIKFEEEDDDLPKTVVTSVLTQSVSSIKVSWTKSPDDDFKNYKVYRSTTESNPRPGKGSVVHTATDINTASYKDTGLAPHTKYYYAVCVTDDANQITCGLGKAATTDNTKPTVTITSPAGGSTYTLVGGEVTVSFTANGSDADGDTIEYIWDFGDGTSIETTSSVTIDHKYITSGPMTVKVKVKDSQGEYSNYYSMSITINP